MSENKLRLSDFDYHLPDNLIAQTPKKKGTSRLMHISRESRSIQHYAFKDILSFFNPGDILVRNNTKVVPARLFGRKETGADIEVLLVNFKEGNIVEALIKPLRRVKCGDLILFEQDLRAEIMCKGRETATLKFYTNGNFFDILSKIGKAPLPKYIKKDIKDLSDYQTVYAKEGLSSAAPTAGLHFTDDIFDKLVSADVSVVDINLNVGLGTFAPIRTEDLSKHKMHTENFQISKEVADIVNQAKSEGRRIFALGTTTLRALESAGESGFVKHGSFSTDIFITPGFEFKIVDALITNFHLPKSTLLMLVSAFADREFILSAYREAVKEKYTFFSFGDAMIIT